MTRKKAGKTAKTKWMALIKNTALILVGNAMLAFLVAAFIIPHDILMGGTTGIGIVIHKLTGFETALSVLIMNVVLLLFGLWILGREFFLSTIVSSILYPLFLGLFQRIKGIDAMTDNTLLAAVFAGVLMGVSLGLVMRAGSSTGGTDIVNLVLAKWTHLPVAVFVWLVDIIIVGMQAPLYHKAEPVLYGVLVLVLESILVDKAMIFGKAKVEVFAVSPKYDEIRTRLLTDARMGVTLSHIETGGMKQQQKAVICVTSPRNLHKVTDLILAVDPEAFLTITQIREVKGQGFSRERVAKELNVESKPSE